MDHKEAVQKAWIDHEAAFKAAREARMEANKEAWRVYDEAAKAATLSFMEVMNSDHSDQP
ncbi:unnamed protein product [marine sediment metagenome]|uniref:Uncharacterized protein n=1 Tax=marine sediment metagenome TaxID=412755 RepID=X1QL68_9ZZZZ